MTTQFVFTLAPRAEPAVSPRAHLITLHHAQNLLCHHEQILLWGHAQILLCTTRRTYCVTTSRFYSGATRKSYSGAMRRTYCSSTRRTYSGAMCRIYSAITRRSYCMWGHAQNLLCHFHFFFHCCDIDYQQLPGLWTRIQKDISANGPQQRWTSLPSSVQESQTRENQTTAAISQKNSSDDNVGACCSPATIAGGLAAGNFTTTGNLAPEDFARKFTTGKRKHRRKCYSYKCLS